MITETDFDNELNHLHDALVKSVRVKSDETERKIELIEIRCAGKQRYCYLRLLAHDKSSGDRGFFRLLVTISYHKSYQEPVLHLRVLRTLHGEGDDLMLAASSAPVEDVDDDCYVDGDDQIKDNYTERTEIIYDMKDILKHGILNGDTLQATDCDGSSQEGLKHSAVETASYSGIPDIEDFLSTGNRPEIHKGGDFYPFVFLAGNITLDYHPVLQNEIWFFAHPCATNDIMSLMSNSGYYLVSWFSVYGRLIYTSIDSKFLKNN